MNGPDPKITCRRCGADLVRHKLGGLVCPTPDCGGGSIKTIGRDTNIVADTDGSITFRTSR